MELEYRFAGMDELDFLVRMRIRDLRMFSECAAGTKLEDAIRRFYEITMYGWMRHSDVRALPPAWWRG